MKHATRILPVRRVHRRADNFYVVQSLQEDGHWEEAEAAYGHSTSAYASLGRAVQRDVAKVLEEAVSGGN